MFGKVQETPQNEKPHFILEALMLYLKFLRTGLQKIIERLIIFLLAMEYYLIMKVPEEEKHLLTKKLH